MNKLILIIITLMLIPTLVFAQITFSGGIEGYTMLGKWDSVSAEGLEDVQTSAGWDLAISAEVFNSNDTAGGKVEFTSEDTSVRAWAYVWWKPINQIYLKVGSIFEDSTWAESDYTTIRGLHANTLDNVRPAFIRPDYHKAGGYAGSILNEGHGFFSPTQVFSGVDLQLTVKPIEDLAFNIGFPMGRNLYFLSNYIDNIHLQAVYYIPLAGEAAIGFVNRPDEDDRVNAFKDLYLQWKMFLGLDMELEFGVNIRMAGLTLSENRHYDGPINIGIGWNKGEAKYDDPLVLTARLGLMLPLADLDPTAIGLDLIFNRAIGSRSRVIVSAGLGLLMPNEGDMLFAWNINPYYTMNLDGPVFFAGVQIFNGGSKWNNYTERFTSIINESNKDQVNWAIPLGLRWDF